MKVFLFAYITRNRYGSYLAFAKTFNKALEAFKSEINYIQYEVIEVTEKIQNKGFVYQETKTND